MGSRTDQYRANVASAAAQNYANQRSREARAAESNLAYQEQFLGSDEQLSGDFSGDPRVAEYAGTYSLSGTSGLDAHEKAGGISNQMQANLNNANQFMAQAKAAAQAGDYQTADRLRAQADAALVNPGSRGSWYPVLNASDIRSFFTYTPSSLDSAQARLGSEQGMALGRQVRFAADLQDESTGAREELEGRLSEGALEAVDAGVLNAERRLATEQRAGDRAARDFGLNRGSARSAQASAAMRARSHERFGTEAAMIQTEAAGQKALIEGQTAAFVETYRHDLLNNTMAFAQSWLQQGAGIREEFQSRLDHLSLAAAEFSADQSQRWENRAIRSEERAAQLKADQRQLAVALGSIALGVALGGVGAAAGGAGLGGIIAGGAKGGTAALGSQSKGLSVVAG